MTTDIAGITNRPIVIVEDDKDDCELLVDVFKEIGVTNEFRCFFHATKAIEYLKTTTEIPFLIVSDINMPLMDGFAFKKEIDLDSDIRDKRIPFVFLSTVKENKLFTSFEVSVQGYFHKPSDVNSLKEIAKTIVSLPSFSL